MDVGKHYLMKKPYRNAYIIKGLNYFIEGFECTFDINEKHDVIGICALWKYDGIATIRGSFKYCSRMFRELEPQYKFYDMEKTVVDYLKQIRYINDSHLLTNYLVLKYENGRHDDFSHIIKYKSVTKHEWLKLKHQGQYFDDQHMEWLVVFAKDQPISHLCKEFVTDQLVVLSHFYTAPEFRGQGIGMKFLKSVLHGLKSKEAIVFVLESNHKAVSIYKQIGFMEVEELINIEPKK